MERRLLFHEVADCRKRAGSQQRLARRAPDRINLFHNILAECRSLCVIPAQAAVQAALCLLWCSAMVSGAKAIWALLFLDSRFRRNDTVGGCSPKGGPNGPGTFWIPAFAGMTPWFWPAGGEGSCFIRLKDYLISTCTFGFSTDGCRGNRYRISVFPGGETHSGSPDRFCEVHGNSGRRGPLFGADT